MLSQLNLRFHKKLIEALKVRAGRENTSVNALAERFLDDGLKTVAPGDGYFQLIADPEATVRQLYRHIILGQTFGTAPVSRDELRFILASARQGYMRGRSRMVSRSPLLTLLQIIRELLAWQVEHDQVTDAHYLKGIFRLQGDDLPEEYERFMAQLPPVVNHVFAEQLLRPLESGCFGLDDFPDEVLAGRFTPARLKAIFPLVLCGLGWTHSQAENLAQELRPIVPAVNLSIQAGTLRLDIMVNGLPADQRPGAWYEPPRLSLIITGKEFVFPCGWAPFAELLGLFTLYVRHPEALSHGHQGEHVMFSPPGDVTKEGFFGIGGLRIFLPAEDFETLVHGLVTRCSDGVPADALSSLRGLYGDL